MYMLSMSGWWLTNLPLWKMMEWKSVGSMKFPIEWKVIKNVPNHQLESNPYWVCPKKLSAQIWWFITTFPFGAIPQFQTHPNWTIVGSMSWFIPITESLSHEYPMKFPLFLRLNKPCPSKPWETSWKNWKTSLDPGHRPKGPPTLSFSRGPLAGLKPGFLVWSPW